MDLDESVMDIDKSVMEVDEGVVAEVVEEKELSKWAAARKPVRAANASLGASVRVFRCCLDLAS